MCANTSVLLALGIILSSPLRIAAQARPYVSIDGGIAYSKTHVHNVLGSGFQSSRSISGAPVRFRFGMETFPETFIELGVGVHLLVDSELKYSSGDSGSRYYQSKGRLAANYSAEIWRELVLSKAISISPGVGLGYMHIAPPSYPIGDYHHLSSSATYANGAVISADSTYARMTYSKEHLINFTGGLKSAYTVTKGLKLIALVQYAINANVYQTEVVDYFRSGQSLKSAEVSYLIPRAYFTLGLAYHFYEPRA